MSVKQTCVIHKFVYVHVCESSVVSRPKKQKRPSGAGNLTYMRLNLEARGNNEREREGGGDN